MESRQKEAAECIKALLEQDDALTEWETTFIYDVNEWRGDLTPKQIETVLKIYDRRC